MKANSKGEVVHSAAYTQHDSLQSQEFYFLQEIQKIYLMEIVQAKFKLGAKITRINIFFIHIMKTMLLIVSLYLYLMFNFRYAVLMFINSIIKK